MENALFNVAILIFAGVASQLVANKFKFPAIVPLLVVGALLGQFELLRVDLLGDGLQTIVHIGVAIILFEGGLSLRRVNYREASKTIRNLITIGIIITWVLGSASAYFLFPELRNPTGLRIAVLFGALITVTGPTVIMPLLKNVKTTKKISTILTWEGILIDPIGALLAVVTLTFIETSSSGGFLVREFIRSMAIGFSVGIGGGLIMNYVLNRRKMISWDLRNLFVLSTVIVVYACSDWLQHETGVLAVTVMGLLLGILKPLGIDEIESFKGQLTTLMVSILFILLAAKLELQSIVDLGWRGVVLLAIVILVIRPINIFTSSVNSDLGLNEKLFLSWIAPRGIVAAAVASLFTTNLSHIPEYANQAAYLETLTFLVIGGTVFIQGGTAKWVGKLLNVLQPPPRGFLFVGASAPARQLAKTIKAVGFKVTMMDINRNNCRAAKKEDLDAIHADALAPDTLEDAQLEGIGNLIAITPNAEVNILACQQGAKFLGPEHVFRIRLQEEQDEQSDETRLKDEGLLLFHEDLTYGSLKSYLRQGWKFYSKKTEHEIIRQNGEDEPSDFIPVFYVKNDHLELVTPNMNVPNGVQLVCFGKEPDKIDSTSDEEEVEAIDLDELGTEEFPNSDSDK
ncbi:MAG: cation:proton antiporter [Candidatus Marinimicrobia bacterium]|nr:cation:proton antiporter [Candidatus Neomarinimicrobiota bacterium]MCF7827335.1 cation:proton antiporter [Candidatus Neomarinimicrobiota bacterium]MCF7881432.1 cation:proton antiporter [Candidatus Neomarinimicrobiota bacterium]